jgi:hypothetical protein
MFGITWAERWLGDGSEEVDQLLQHNKLLKVAVQGLVLWPNPYIHGPIARPPRSPDLTPLDFFLWGYVKNTVYQVKINDLQHQKPA